MNILNIFLLSFTLDAGAFIEDYSVKMSDPETQLYFAKYEFTLSDTREIMYMKFSIENIFAKSETTMFFAPGLDIYTSEIGLRVKGLTIYIDHNCQHRVVNKHYTMILGWQSLTRVGVRIKI